MSKVQLLRTLPGIAGTYRKQDAVDIAYERVGRSSLRLASSPETPR